VEGGARRSSDLDCVHQQLRDQRRHDDIALILGVPAAYALARFEFPIKSNDIALWFLSQRVLPPAVVLVPFNLLLVYLHLIDTWTGLIVCYSAFNLAFVVVIMRDIFRDEHRDRGRG
jgi:ABC-type glycerol-3-phosphate transport system permease component